MSDFMISNKNLNENEELDEIKNIRLTIDYFKEIKEQEIKEKNKKEKELLELQIKQEEFTPLKI